MATGAEHKAAAEELMAEHLKIKNHGLYTITPWTLTMAEIHAILVLEAAVRGEP